MCTGEAAHLIDCTHWLILAKRMSSNTQLKDNIILTTTTCIKRCLGLSREFYKKKISLSGSTSVVYDAMLSALSAPHGAEQDHKNLTTITASSQAV